MFFKIKVIQANVFKWLQEIQANILIYSNQKLGEMQDLILKNMSSFIEMDPK